MPKFPPGQSLTPARGANIKGLGIWKQSRGRQVFQKQPKSQKVARTPAEAANRATLKASTLIVPYLSAEQQLFARDVSQGTQLAVRDFLFILLFNRAFYIKRPNGQKVYSMASYTDVSQILDAIYQVENGLLVRGPAWWQGIAPGDVGQALTVQPDGSLGWSAGSSGSFGEWWRNPPRMQPDGFTANLNNNLIMLFAFQPQSSTSSTGIKNTFHTTSGTSTFTGVIYQAHPVDNKLDGATLIAQTPATTIAPGDCYAQFATPVALTKGQWYFGGYLLKTTGSVSSAPTWDTTGYYTVNAPGGVIPTTVPSHSLHNDNEQTWWLA